MNCESFNLGANGKKIVFVCEKILLAEYINTMEENTEYLLDS